MCPGEDGGGDHGAVGGLTVNRPSDRSAGCGQEVVCNAINDKKLKKNSCRQLSRSCGGGGEDSWSGGEGGGGGVTWGEYQGWAVNGDG